MLVKNISMIYGTSQRLSLLSAWYGSLDSLVRPEGFHCRSRSGPLKWRFEDIGKALSCLLRSRRMTHGHVQSIIRDLFAQYIEGGENQGKSSCEGADRHGQADRDLPLEGL